MGGARAAFILDFAFLLVLTEQNEVGGPFVEPQSVIRERCLLHQCIPAPKSLHANDGQFNNMPTWGEQC